MGMFDVARPAPVSWIVLSLGHFALPAGAEAPAFVARLRRTWFKNSFD